MAPIGQEKSLSNYTSGLGKDKSDVWTITSTEESPLYQPQPYTELFIEFEQQNQRKYSF